jgi:hypothetical protein
LRKLIIGGIALLLAIAAWNYVGIHHAVTSRLNEDPRNKKISIWAYQKYGVIPSVLVLDLRRISAESSTAEILLALFEAAESLQHRRFDHVELTYRGKAKLVLDGAYFQAVGKRFQNQDLLHTMQTLPENVRRLDGSAAYGRWTGGWLGVMGKQIEDVNKFARDWYLDDWTKE